MKIRFTWILTIFLLSVVQISLAQEKLISGIVVSKNVPEPIHGATILIEGTETFAETNQEGKYFIKAKPGDNLVVQLAGYKDLTATVGESNKIDFALVEDTGDKKTDEVLKEVVVDVYRTTSKIKSNVAASTITSKTLEGRPNAAFMQTMQGQVPGLNVSSGSGQPGQKSTVILRGLGSLNGQKEPLYVIDGVPTNSDRFRSINPNDFENVTVLKDAGATSIYGNRGANGVIVITTKKGNFESDLEVKYVGSTGISTLQGNNYNVMNGSEYLDFENKVYQSGIKEGSPKTAEEIANAHSENWVDTFFQNAISQSHTLSFTSGGKNLSSFTSVGYSDFEGILRSTGMKRFNFRNNLDGKSSDSKLKYSTNTSVNFSKNKLSTGQGGDSSLRNYVFGALASLPFLNPNEYKGTYESINEMASKYGIMGMMPFALLDKRRTNLVYQDELKVLVNGSLNYSFNENWKASTMVGIDYQNMNGVDTMAPDSFLAHDAVASDQQYFGYLNTWNEQRAIINSTSNINWSKIFADKHEFKVGGYMEYLKGHWISQTMQKVGFDPIFYTPGTTAGWINDTPENDYYVPGGSLDKQDAGLFSIFGTFDYDFDTKYGLGVTVRRDASYRFDKDNKWGTFWSVSGRWNISNEKFMEGSVINDLKLRGSYGTSGNQDITGSGIFGSGNLYQTVFSSSTGYNSIPGLRISQIPNRGLQWENISQGNIGLDFALFNSRIRGTIDVYRKTTSNLYQSIPISGINNGASKINANFGSLHNQGIELILAGEVIDTNDTKLTINLNGSYNENKVFDLPNAKGYVWGGGYTGLRENNIINEFYLYKYAGVNKENGNALFYDKDGKLTETPKETDRQWLGKSAIPKYQGAFGFDFKHKGFFASANFTFTKDVWRYDADYYFLTNGANVGNMNFSNDLKDFWTPENPNASFPRLNASNNGFVKDSDKYLQDASYLRLRYLTVGYNFTKQDLKFIGLNNLRVYFQAENLHTWSKWRGWDAESDRTADLGQYPTPKTFTVGLEVQF